MRGGPAKWGRGAGTGWWCSFGRTLLFVCACDVTGGRSMGTNVDCGCVERTPALVVCCVLSGGTAVFETRVELGAASPGAGVFC